MANLGKIVYLSEAQLQTLFTNGSVTSGNTTITYSENDLYVTPASPAAEVSVLSPSGNTHTLRPCPVTYNFGEKSELTVSFLADIQATNRPIEYIDLTYSQPVIPKQETVQK